MITVLPHEKIDILSKYLQIISETEVIRFTGFVDKIIGLTIESVGPVVRYGDVCKIITGKDEFIYAEVVGFRAKDRPVLMPIGEMSGIIPGAEVISLGRALLAPVGEELLGRVIDGVGTPLDGKGHIITKKKYPVDGQLISKPLSTGIRALDGMLTIGRGQRIGIFSGSGVGKSTTLGMIARYTDADINVIALIGERGKELRDFIEKELGPEGLKKSVVIVATSDQPPMVKIRGSYLAHSIAEYFRDQGKDVNLLMDSVTRFAMAQREVGLAAGEVSATKGYPPSVFKILPRMLERSGAGEVGTITGFYTVLIEADDMNDPIADTVRGILDGHVVLDRNIANKGHYPSIDVLASVSRCMKDVITNDHKQTAMSIREMLAAYKDAEDMISIGSYRKGMNKTTDRAIDLIDSINSFLKQGIYEESTFDETIKRMDLIINPQKFKRAPKADYVASQYRSAV